MRLAAGLPESLVAVSEVQLSYHGMDIIGMRCLTLYNVPVDSRP